MFGGLPPPLPPRPTAKEREKHEDDLVMVKKVMAAAPDYAPGGEYEHEGEEISGYLNSIQARIAAYEEKYSPRCSASPRRLVGESAPRRIYSRAQGGMDASRDQVPGRDWNRQVWGPPRLRQQSYPGSQSMFLNMAPLGNALPKPPSPKLTPAKPAQGPRPVQPDATVYSQRTTQSVSRGGIANPPRSSSVVDLVRRQPHAHHDSSGEAEPGEQPATDSAQHASWRHSAISHIAQLDRRIGDLERKVEELWRDNEELRAAKKQKGERLKQLLALDDEDDISMETFIFS